MHEISVHLAAGTVVFDNGALFLTVKDLVVLDLERVRLGHVIYLPLGQLSPGGQDDNFTCGSAGVVVFLRV